MNTFTLLKATFTNPLLLLEARKKNGFVVFIYMVLLAIILSIPILVQSLSLLTTFREDGQKIIEKVPEFSISNGTLVCDKTDAGFIYQTDAMIFTFDPDGKRSNKEIESDGSTGVLSIALLKNEMLLVLPSVGTTTDILDNNVVSVPYTLPQLKNFDKSFLAHLLTSKAENRILLIVILVVSTFMIFLGLLFCLIIMTFCANIFSKFGIIRLRFTDIFKILVYCSTFPILLTAILQLFWPSFSFSTISLILTIIIYLNIFPKPKRPNRK